MKDRELLELLPQCAAEVIKSWCKEQNKKENYTPERMSCTSRKAMDSRYMAKGKF